MFRKKRKNDGKQETSKSVVIISVLSLMVLIAFVIFMRYLQNKSAESTVNVGEQLKSSADAKANRAKSVKKLALNEISHGTDMDYIEIYNASSLTIDMSGYKLTVGNDEYTFPKNSSIGSKSFMTVHFAQAGAEVSERLMFGDTQTACLYDKDGQSIDYINVPDVSENESYAREKDGEDQFCFEAPTEGTANESGKIQKKNYPIISVPSGMYADTIQVKLTAEQGMKIYYTLDGSDPTVQSTLYSEPINVKDVTGNDNVYAAIDDLTFYGKYTAPQNDIDKATVLKAIAVDSAGNASEISSATYFINYADRSQYKGIPIISVVTDPKNLFDYRQGIYVRGETYGTALLNDSVSSKTANFWTKGPCTANVQYYEPDGVLSYQGDVSLSILKDSGINEAQKGLLFSEIKAGESSNAGLFKYVSYQNKSGELSLTNGEDDYLSKSRSNIVNTLMEGTKTGTSESKFCAVFIDGEYWGVYLMGNSLNADYVSRTYKVSDPVIVKDGIAENKKDQAEYSALKEFFSESHMESESMYQQAESLVDMQSLIDYYCAVIYTGETSIGNGNGIIWKSRNVGTSEYEDGKWRWILGDVSDSMALSEVNEAKIDHFSANSLKSDVVFSSLMRNRTFQTQFTARFQEMSDKYMSAENVDKVIAEFKQYNGVMTGFYERFQNKSDSKMYEQQLDTINEFLTDRPEYIMDYLDDYLDEYTKAKEIIVKIAKPEMGSVMINNAYQTDSGTGVAKALAADDEWVTLTAKPDDGYVFQRWVNGNGVTVYGENTESEQNFASDTASVENSTSSENEVQGVNMVEKIRISSDTSVTAVFSKIK
jgi:hypothetical protein